MSILQKSDLEFYKSIYSNEELMCYVGPLMDDAQLIKCFAASLRKSHEKKGKHILYVIRLKSNNQRIGLIGLSWNQSAIDEAEIGVIIAKNYHRHGYAFGALNCLFRHSFECLNIKTLVGISYANNVASNIMVEKIGFKKIREFINKKNNIPSIRWEITKECIK